MTKEEILHKIIPNPEIEIPQSKQYFDKLEPYEKNKVNGISKVGIAKKGNY